MKKIKFLIILLSGLVLCLSIVNNKHMYFELKQGNKLLINDEQSIPEFNEKITDYYARSFSALKRNKIAFGDKTYFYQTKSIEKDEKLLFYINNKKYTIHLRPDFMPDYEIISTQKNKYGYVFLTPFNGRYVQNSYAYIIDTKGNLLYYRRNKNENRYVSDFKKTVLKNKKIRYSLMEQERKMPPYIYWYGSLFVMNNQFEPLKNLKLLPYNNHEELMIENHDSLLIDDNHYILASYYPTETFDLKTGEPIRIVATILQEIKNDRVVFEWNSADYPQFLETSNHHILPNNPQFIDYMHFNSIIIDPKDNNLILSFATQSSLVKINRKTGDIMWILGGFGDEFGLSDDMKFVGQHTPLIRNSNEIILFDNAQVFKKNVVKNRRNVSSVLHFTLDENNKKITNWKRIKLPFYAKSMGSVQITENKTYFIGGGSSKNVAALELNENGQEIWRLSLKNNYTTYRAYKYNSL